MQNFNILVYNRCKFEIVEILYELIMIASLDAFGKCLQAFFGRNGRQFF